ncbi:hypothetical protein FRB94_006261 [Tulasnella sp. JGI-2019a]|nr:hypothetical protein FRB93_006693 [Tulasnella sp. JGI-2019a]KAG8999276.1 hypothetical protein FRB94_006261 [Tulasnella sp. JGI-2019a]
MAPSENIHDRRAQRFSRKGTSSEYLSYLPIHPTRLRRSYTFSEVDGKSTFATSNASIRPPPTGISRPSSSLSYTFLREVQHVARKPEGRQKHQNQSGLVGFLVGITDALEEASKACLVESAAAAIANEIGVDISEDTEEEDKNEFSHMLEALGKWQPEVLAEELEGLDESGDMELDPLIQETIDELLEMMNEDTEDGFAEGYRLEDESSSMGSNLKGESARDEWSLFP